MPGRTVTTLTSAKGNLVQVGGMFFTSSLGAADAETAFATLRQLLQQAGLTSDNLGLVTVCLNDPTDADAVDKAWGRMFPDRRSGPVLKINEYGLPSGERVQVQATGAVGQARRRIDIPGFTDDLSVGLRLGDMVFSAPIDGRDPQTGQRSADSKTQMRQAFRNLEAFIRQAGGSKDDFVHVFIFLSGKGEQKAMLDIWLEEFPEEGKRPARKAIFDESLLRDGKIIHLLAVGVIGQGKRTNLEIPGINKSHPNPMGCRIGRMVFSSGMGGSAPGVAKDASLDVLAFSAFQNMRRLMEAAGGSLADVGLVSITVNTYDDEPQILRQWRKVFPDPADEPARHVMAFGGRGSYPIQLHVIAALDR